MGNGSSIPEDAKDRFATIELECIQKRFEQLAHEGSYRRQTFDLRTFKRHYLTRFPEMADMIFHAFDCDGNSKLDLKEFVEGISHCTRGERKEKLRFIFAMFDQNRSQMISRKEFCAALQSNFFASEQKESASDRKKRIEESVNRAFQFDADNDGYLNVTEFTTWADQAKEVEKILQLFTKMDDELTQNSSAVAADPFHVSHDTHVGVNQKGALLIDNIPDVWVKLFKEAGASDKELEDPEMVGTLMTIVAAKMTEKATGKKAVEWSRPETDSPTVSETKRMTEQRPQPAKDSDMGQEEPLESSEPSAPKTSSTPAQSNDAIPPPPSNPPPAPPSEPVEHKSAGLMAEIKQGVKLEHAETQQHKPSDSPFGSLMSEIKQGKKLKHVDPSDFEQLEPVERDDLTYQLSQAIKMHRQKMNMTLDDEENNDDYWD